MNYVAGSAITIKCEVPTDKITGTIIILDSLIDPDGIDLASSEVLSFGTGDDAATASCTIQTTTAYLVGRYTYELKAINGMFTNFIQGAFFITEKK